MPDTKRDINLSDNDLPAPAQAGHCYLLAIGIDQYRHCPRLYNAVQDAREFVALMKEKYGFAGENATVLTLYDDEATSRNIQAKLRQLVAQITPNDSFILYFSGHGAFDKNMAEGYWVPVDAEKGQYDDYLPNSTLETTLSAIKSRHTFLIADSCFSGTMFTATATRDMATRLEQEPSRWGLTSGRNEIVADGKPGENSPFAQELLKQLRSSEQPLGVAALCAKMMEVVTANAEQTPRGEPLAIRGHEGGQYYFRPADPEAAAWKTAAERNDLKAWEQFLHRYPDSPRRAEAAARLAALRADADWKAAERLDKQAAYFDFIAQYPHDARTANARQRMEELADDQKWKESDAKGGLWDYSAYLEAFPKGQHAAKANAEIRALREPEPPPTVLPKPEPPPRLVTPKPAPPPKPVQETVPVAFLAEKTAEQPQEVLSTSEKLTTLWARNRVLFLGLFALLCFSIWWVPYIMNKPPEGITERGDVTPEGITERGDVTPASKPVVPVVSDEFAFIKGGTYSMGDVMDDKLSINETPHTVTVSDFYLSKYEVSFEDFDAFCTATGRKKNDDYGWGRGKRPAINTDWYDAIEYCNWRSQQDGLVSCYTVDKANKDPNHENTYDPKRWIVTCSWTNNGYRLPTEAEWEYAAREGGKKVRFGNGRDVIDPTEINFDAMSNRKPFSIAGEFRQKTVPVTELSANAFGLKNMSGNVMEWCWDWHDEKYYAESGGARNPRGDSGGSARVLRGGSWGRIPEQCRVAYRGYLGPAYRLEDVGFRLARTK